MPLRRDASLACQLLLIGLGAALACGGGDAPPRHLLLISVDTLRADRVGAWGSPLGLTPRLDALAAEATVFAQAFAPAPFTLPSVSSLLSGRHPESLGIRRNSSLLPRSLPTLASALYGEGFRTGAVVSNFVLRREAGLAAGFETYDDRLPELEARRPYPERTATHTTDAAVRLLDALSEDGSRFFLWVHYQDPHGPYTPPPGARERFLEAERHRPDGRRRLPVSSKNKGIGAIPAYQHLPGSEEVAFYRAGYHAEVQVVDEEIGRLLDALAARGLVQETLVAVTADHGEALGERDHWFAHGEHLSDAELHVPLLLRIPGRTPARRADLVGLVDLAPTLLALLGAAPLAHTVGRDLFAEHPPGESTLYVSTLGMATVSRRGVMHGEWRYLEELREAGSVGRLERVGGDDETDRSAVEPERAAALAAELGRWRARLAAPDAARQPLSAGDRERLRALGYLADEDPEP